MLNCFSSHSRVPKIEHHKPDISAANMVGATQVLPDNETNDMTDDGKNKYPIMWDRDIIGFYISVVSCTSAGTGSYMRCLSRRDIRK